MSLGFQRRFAKTVCDILQRILPTRLQPWGLAVRNEIAAIPSDTKALLFAVESLWGLAPSAITIHLRCISIKLTGGIARSSGGTINMGYFEDMVRRPRQVGIASAITAVMLGLVYMIICGAPITYIGINAGALTMGLFVLALLSRITIKSEPASGTTTLLFALGLLATALVGDRIEGAARWVDLGPLYVQPSLILLPVMVVSFARSRNVMSMIGLIVATTALAIQPDRAMAGMLAAGLAALTVIRRDRFTVPALIVSVIGFAATLVQADTLPSVPFVDQILYTSFDANLIAGAAVLGGAIMLVIPAILGGVYDKDNRQTYYVFGAVWLAAIAAAALGNYPTPVVGYSGGAVLGYVLSLAILPKYARSHSTVEQGPERERRSTESTIQHLRAAYA